MLETGIRRLLEDAVNTSCKLAIVMVYAQQGGMSATPAQMSERLCRDVWSMETAMQELAEDGILAEDDGQYRLCPSPRHRERLARLISVYDEPMYRQEIVELLGDLDRYAPYRELMKNRVTIVS